MTPDVPIGQAQAGSAQIILFPAGGRTGLRAARAETKPAADLRAAPVASGAWYHDAAIQEAPCVRER